MLYIKKSLRIEHNQKSNLTFPPYFKEHLRVPPPLWKTTDRRFVKSLTFCCLPSRQKPDSKIKLQRNPTRNLNSNIRLSFARHTHTQMINKSFHWDEVFNLFDQLEKH